MPSSPASSDNRDSESGLSYFCGKADSRYSTNTID